MYFVFGQIVQTICYCASSRNTMKLTNIKKQGKDFKNWIEDWNKYFSNFGGNIRAKIKCALNVIGHILLIISSLL